MKKKTMSITKILIVISMFFSVFLLKPTKVKADIHNKVEHLSTKTDGRFSVNKGERLILELLYKEEYNGGNWVVQDEEILEFLFQQIHIDYVGGYRKTIRPIFIGKKKGNTEIYFVDYYGDVLISETVSVFDPEAVALEEAITSVVKAEASKLDTDINDAKLLVNNLTESADKKELLKRLELVQVSIDIKEAKLILNQYINKEEYTINIEAIEDAILAGNEAIEQSETVDAVEAALIDAKKALDELKSDAVIKSEEILAEAKVLATLKLADYKKETDYKINIVALNTAILDGKSAISEANTIEVVESALVEAQKVIDGIKSDAEVQEEKLNIAIEKVTKAEESKLQSDLDTARELVTALDDSIVKESLINRLDELQTQLRIGWIKEDSHWYYYDDNNTMQTGWTKVKDQWYYMAGSGEMQTGWHKLNGNWFYMNSSGKMETGWTKVDNTWYYMNSSGAMQTGWMKVGNTWYYMTANGAMQTGWTKVGNTWYYMTDSGAMQTGWTKVGSTWYYITGSGAMQTGWTKVGNTWYYMTGSGAMQTGWTKVGNTWYYMNSSGAMQTGWLKLGSNWYFLNSNGSMQVQNKTINGRWYRFDSSGRML